jgi:dihydroorotate dehydrogenase electron transfer subunit
LKAAGEPFELFACGPDPMLKAVAERACAAKMPGWISMDRHMICGVGACYACVQKTVRGYSRCCIEGPVFRAEDLIFD